MWLSKKIKTPRELIDQYRLDLDSGLNVAPESEKSLYKIHLESLKTLERILNEKRSIEEIAAEVGRERHAHGWSFLSGLEGERATTPAHQLLSELEKQIFRIKGKDWYYSDEHQRQST